MLIGGFSQGLLEGATRYVRWVLLGVIVILCN